MAQSINEYRLLAFEHLFDAVVITDISRIIQDWNSGAEMIYGYKRDEIVGKPITILEPEHETGKNLTEILNEVEHQGKWSGEVKILFKDGGSRWTDSVIHSITNDSGQHTAILWISRDITERIMTQERMKALEYYDGLTGIPNHLVMYDRLRQMIAAARRNQTMFAIFLVKLNRLKKIHDTGGPRAGDAVLRDVAQRLQSVLRQSDTVARVGNNEFVVLAGEIHSDKDAGLIMENVAAAFRGAFIANEYAFQISASIGMAIYPQDGDTSDELLIKVHKAMEQDKQAQRRLIMVTTETT